MRSDARKRADEAVDAYLSLRRGAGVVPSPGGDATTPAPVALTLGQRAVLVSASHYGAATVGARA